MFFNISCFYFFISIQAHSCCGVPANVLSVCLFVCLFFFGESNKNNNNKKIQIATATTAVIISIPLEKYKTRMQYCLKYSGTRSLSTEN